MKNEAEGLPIAEWDLGKPVYLRIGRWNPAQPRPRNARGAKGAGLSVYDLDGDGQPIAPANSKWAEIDMQNRLRGAEPKFLVQGEWIGVGHDGEPLLENVRIVGLWESYIFPTSLAPPENC